MTENLHAKFGTLETQIAADHTELMAALNSIAYALGAPPTAPTVTLADVVEALNIGNLVLAGIRSEQATQSTAALSALNSIDLTLSNILDNNSTNTKALLAAMYATFCGCTTTVPLLPPPLDVTPTTIVDDAKCRRIQFYLSVFANWLGKIANYAGAAGFVTGDAIGTLLGLAATEAAITATGAEVGVVGGPPGVIIGAIVGLITGAIFIFGSAVVSDYATQFVNPTLQHALLLALYAANNADEGQSAFESVIAANFATVPGAIINALWWSAWSNDIYSGMPVVDDSAFDGSICAPPPETNCVTVNSTNVTYGGDGPGASIVWPSPLTAVSSLPGGYSANAAVWCTSALVGYSITPTVDVGMRLDYNSGGFTIPAHTTYVVSGATNYASINIYPSTVAFSIELCPPV